MLFWLLWGFSVATSYNCFKWKCADLPVSPEKCANYYYDTI